MYKVKKVTLTISNPKVFLHPCVVKDSLNVVSDPDNHNVAAIRKTRPDAISFLLRAEWCERRNRLLDCVQFINS